jgi:predicted metal-dependent enzyme (double-stranded beta helix superfamily)
MRDFLDAARLYASRPDDWPFAPRFDPARRWYHRLHAADRHEAWLLTWLPGQGTDLHDHGGSAGAFVVVTGTLTELVAARTGKGYRLLRNEFADGKGHSFGTHHIHQVSNESDRPAVSLHVYGPALTTMNRYRLDGARLTLTDVDRAGVTW